MGSLRVRAAVAVAGAWVFGAAGCSPGGPATHRVSGRVEAPGGDVARLAGSVVEAVSVSDPGVRASGVIRDDGTFRLESLHAGTVRDGAPEGAYRVRIVPNDEDGPTRKRAGQAIAPRFRKFEQSGLSLRVPADATVTLSVSPR